MHQNVESLNIQQIQKAISVVVVFSVHLFYLSLGHHHVRIVELVHWIEEEIVDNTSDFLRVEEFDGDSDKLTFDTEHLHD